MKLRTRIIGTKKVLNDLNYDIKKAVLKKANKELTFVICRFELVSDYETNYVCLKDLDWKYVGHIYTFGHPMFYPSKKVIVFKIKQYGEFYRAAMIKENYDFIEFYFTDYGWKRILTYMKKFRRSIYRK